MSAATRKLLHSRRAKVLKAARSAIRASQTAAASSMPHRANISAEVRTVRTVLAELRAQVAVHTDPKSAAAAAALADLESSLAKLQAAGAAKTPQEASALLVAGYRQFAAAEKKAKAAGSAWGL